MTIRQRDCPDSLPNRRTKMSSGPFDFRHTLQNVLKKNYVYICIFIEITCQNRNFINLSIYLNVLLEI